MAREELEIEISPTGKVTVRTRGIKGPECVDVVELFTRLIGKEEARQLTSEYYETATEVQGQLQQKLKR